MFPEEEESQIGRQIQVKLPEYLLLAKGYVELQGRNFIAASNMAPTSEEGEKEQERKIIKTIWKLSKLYIFHYMEYVIWTIARENKTYDARPDVL
jgi:hypothetical protein